ncbi:MAG: tetratricopeptide repeat protein [Bacteroidales bacterium]|nr:tetratricopeptide repeat protein [Bacteroidales bacterium]
MKRIYLLIFFLVLFNQLIAQNSDYYLPDSLHVMLQKSSTNQKERIIVLEKAIDYLFEEYEYAAALPYVNEMNELATNHKNVYYKALGNYYLGTILLDKYEITESIQCLITAKNLLGSLPENAAIRQLLSRIYLSSSACYQRCNMLSEAYNQVQNGLEVCTETDSKTIWLKLNNNLAVIYNEMHKRAEAIDIYKDILSKLNDFSDKSSIKQRMTYTANLNIGQCYFWLNVLDSSLIYLDYAYNEAITDIQKANVLETRASQYAHNNDYVLAEKNYKEALDLIKSENNFYLLASVFLSMANVYYQTEKYDSALTYVNLGIENAQKCSRLSMETSGLFMKAQILDKLHRLQESISYLYAYKMMIDSLYGVQNIEKLSQLMLQTEVKAMEKEYMQQQDIANLKQSRERLLYYSVIVVLIAVVLVVVLLLNRKRILLRNKQIKEKMLSAELEARNRELAFNVIELMKKNEVFTEIITKLVMIKENAVKDDTKNSLSKVIKEIEKTTEGKFWEEFEIRFKQVHSDFYNNLMKKFPNLTTNEIRLCAFLKLNMTTKDISSITGQSTLSIEQARYRLRRKLGIQNEMAVKLTNFISNI